MRLGQLENVVFEDTETTFAQVHERIAKTIALLEKVPKEALDGREDAEVNVGAGPRTYVFTGTSYVTDYIIPNFFFHLVITYALLRKEGVPIGKGSYLGRIESREARLGD